MSKDPASEHYLLVRPDLNDSGALDSQYLTLHTLATADVGQAIRSFVVEVNGVFEKIAEPADWVRKIYISGQLITGDNVACELTYDDSDHTQMLTIETMGSDTFLDN